MNTPKRTKSPVEGLSPMWQKSIKNALANTPRRLHRTSSPMEKGNNSPLRKTNLSPLHKAISPAHKTNSPLKPSAIEVREIKTRVTASHSQVLSPLSQKQLDKRSNTPKKSKLLKETVGPISHDSPFKRKAEPKKYDRFIPNRQIMDMVSSQFNLLEKGQSKHLDVDTLAYQEEMAKACGLALDQRILAFKAEPPVAKKEDLRATWNRPLKGPNSKNVKRKIPASAERVLDAPGMVDDYYLNLLDWSSRNLLAVGLENTVYLWDANSGSVQEFLSTVETDPVTSLQWTSDGSYLAVGLNSGDTQIWDVDSGSKIRSMKGRATRVGVLSWEKHIVSSGSRDGSIWNHDVRIARHKVAELIGHTAEVCGLKWRPDGQLLASGGNDNLVNIWDARSSQPKITKGNHTAAVKAIAWCPWQLNLLCTGGGSNDKTIHFWNTSTSGKIASIPTGSQVTSLQWSREYKELVSTHGFPNNHLTIWSYPSLNKIADLEGHDTRILHSALSPDGQTLATCAADESLKFWKTFEAKPKAKKAVEDEDLAKATSKLTIRAKVTGKDGSIQKISDDLTKSPMIKSLRSREIPLITRKWKEKRKVKIRNTQNQPESQLKLSTDVIIKTAQKFKNSSAANDTFHVELLKTTLSKLKNMEEYEKNEEVSSEEKCALISPTLPHNDHLLQFEADDCQVVHSRQDVSNSDPDDSDTVRKCDKSSFATKMEIAVSDHLYPGVPWNVDTLFQVSNLIAPSLRYSNASPFIDFTKRKRVISPEILKLYHISISTKDAGKLEFEARAFDEQDLNEASIHVLENSRDSATANTKGAFLSKKLSSPASKQRQITKTFVKNPGEEITSYSGPKGGSRLTPFQFQKSMQATKQNQIKCTSKPFSAQNINIDSGNLNHAKDDTLKSTCNYEKSSLLDSNNWNRMPMIQTKIPHVTSSPTWHLRDRSPVESIAPSCVHSIRPPSSVVSMDRSSFLSRSKKFLPVTLGKLGPDKESDSYRMQLEKKNRQLEYAERIRKLLAEKTPKKSSRPSSVSGNNFPQILTNYSATEAANALAKRNRMKDYAQSIKRPIKTCKKGEIGISLPDIPQKKNSQIQDLNEMEREHASSMMEVLNIRRQLNL